jgi:hypothetical protein
MTEQSRFDSNLAKITNEYERLKDVDVPQIEDKDGKYFSFDFPFDNHIAKNWQSIREELDLKRQQLEGFFEHAGDQYYGMNKDGIGVSIGDYRTYALVSDGKPFKWFESMFPETSKFICDCNSIIYAGLIVAKGKSGLNPHYGPGADVYWPMLRGQTILKGDGNSLLCQLHDDQIYLRTQAEGDSFYFDDTNMHWTKNFSDDERVLLVYDFIDPSKDSSDFKWKNHEGMSNRMIYLLANHK